MAYKLLSLFDGSGGFPLAGSLCGIEPVAASEVEPYPIAVTRSRFPGMKHLGDIQKINGAEIEPVNVITFGSPCQDLSIAGKRAGIKHDANGDEEATRSGLFMEAVRIIKEMWEATNGVYPNVVLWENVPGAFSSNRGGDFRIVLEELIKIVEKDAVMPPVPKAGWAYADSYCGDRWSLAYRVFDAQHWGVPQRRRRIHLVLDLRGQRAGKILFERDGLRGYFATGRVQRQRTAADTKNSVKAGNRVEENSSVTFGFPLGFRPENVRVYEEKSATICNGTRPGFTTAIICMATQQGGAEVRSDDKAPTITAAAGMSGNNQPVVCYRADSVLPFDTTQITSPMNYSNPQFGDPCHPLAAGAHPPAVICKCYGIGNGQSNQSITEEKIGALNCMHDQQAVIYTRSVRWVVRRLIPLECNRLQGFADMWGVPDLKEDFTEDEYRFWLEVRNTYAEINGKAVKNYTKNQMLTWYNKLHTDSAEYKMWGNGIALPPALYCMQGIVDALNEVNA